MFSDNEWCLYNDFIMCSERERTCERCGFYPEEDERRREKLRNMDIDSVAKENLKFRKVGKK